MHFSNTEILQGDDASGLFILQADPKDIYWWVRWVKKQKKKCRDENKKNVTNVRKKGKQKR